MSQFPLVAVKSTTYRIHHPDIGPTQRSLSLLAGSLLLLNALRSGGVGGVVQAAFGAYCVYRGASGNCVLQRKLAPTPFEQQFQRSHGWKASEALTRSVTIGKPLEQVLAFLRQPQNIGPLIPWVDTVEAIDERTSKWTLQGPLGRTVSWTLEMDEPDEPDTLCWHTVPAGRWQHDIRVSLKNAPGERGTEVKVVAVCEPAGGKLGYALASAVSVFSDKALLNLLGSLKQQLETGEVSTNEMRASEMRDFVFLHAPAEQAAQPATDHPPTVAANPVSAESAPLPRSHS
ncbi:cyclase/dehydrase [Pseudomonas sp. v388]|uniref:SRPBCC family protein n=1 Tax=Pseudomonas sp. v388 TaxID=2479849 RepID=UPI000F7AC686|nr:SRPBCC family protein [Pseudomonas sp. v388]RRV10610.1 cyclase/dehydrase [Pseudomonas sp. v388]